MTEILTPNSQPSSNEVSNSVKILTAILGILTLIFATFAMKLFSENSELKTENHRLTHTTDVFVHNPTEGLLIFKLNDTEYKVDNVFAKISLPYGKYTVIRGSKNMGEIEINEDSTDGIINPTGQNFIKKQVIYSDEDSTLGDDVMNETTLHIGGEPYTGRYEFIEKKIFLEKNWDFAPWEISPERIYVEGDYRVIYEMYGEKQFSDVLYSDTELQEIQETESEE